MKIKYFFNIIFFLISANSIYMQQTELSVQFVGNNAEKLIPYQFGINGPYFSTSIYLSEDGYIYILQIDGILRKYDFNMDVVYSLNFNTIDNRVMMGAGQNLVKAIVRNNKIYIMCNGPLKDTKCFLVFSMEGELLYEKKGNFLGLEQASFYGFEIINEMIIIPDQQFPKFYYIFNYLNSNIDIYKEFNIKNLYPENYQFTDNLYFENKIWNYLNNNCHGIWYDHFFYNLGLGHLTGFLLPYINNIDLESNKAVTIFNEIKYWYNNDEIVIGAGAGIDIMDNLYITYIYPNGNVLLYIFKNKKFLKKISGMKKNANEKILKFFVNPNGDILIWAEYIPEGESSWSNNIRLNFYKIPNTWDPIPDSVVQTYINDLNKQGLPKVKRISTSGYASEQFDKNIYHPIKLFDGNPKTAWIENSKDFGIKAFVEVEFQSPILIDEIRISGGYFDAQYYNSNNRLKKARLAINSNTYVMEFVDQMVPQSFKLPAAQELGKFGIEILDAYLAVGQTWNDTAISELEFYYKGKKVEIDLGDYGQYLKVVPVVSSGSLRLRSVSEAFRSMSIVHHVLPGNRKIG